MSEEETYANLDNLSKKRSRFRKPFKIYENFRNVYKGVQLQKNRSDDDKNMDSLPHATNSSTCPSSLESLMETRSASENIREVNNVSSDGDSSTDDSGIDSICCSNNSNRDKTSPDKTCPDEKSGSSEESSGNFNSTNVWTTTDLTREKICKVQETIRKLEHRQLAHKVRGSKLNKKPSIRISRQDQQSLVKYEAKNLAELNKLLNDTGKLLSRNSNLRASMSISTKRPTNNNNGSMSLGTATITIPTPKLARKANNNNNLKLPKKEVHFERAKPNLVNRRSMRLAPKTVANLASKFENKKSSSTSLTATAEISQEKEPIVADCDYSALGVSKKLGERKNVTNNPELRLVTKSTDISKIIRGLNKLEEEAAKDTAVLRRSLRRAALEAIRNGNNNNKNNELCIQESENDAARTQKNVSSSKVVTSLESELVSDSNLTTEVDPNKSNENRRENLWNADVFHSSEQVLEECLKSEQKQSTVAGDFNDSSQQQQSSDYYYERVGNNSTNGYDDVASNSHKYLQLGGLGNSYMDLASAVYSELGSARGDMLYDDVTNPSVHTYLSLYDKNGSEYSKSIMNDGIVKAKPAIVVEDDEDDSKIYSNSIGTGLYESIAGSILNLARDKYSDGSYNKYADTGSKLHPHEVLTYTLTKLSSSLSGPRSSDASTSSNFERSFNSSVRSDCNKSTSADEWVDIETDTDQEDTGFLGRNHLGFAR